MIVITGLRHRKQFIPLNANDIVGTTVDVLQMRETKIWFEVIDGVLCMRDMPLEWRDVPSEEIPNGNKAGT